LNLLAQVILWSCLLVVVYAYAFYPALLFFAYAVAQVRRDWRYLVTRKDRRAGSPNRDALPTASLIIPAYNEEAHLRQKIRNLREVDYPAEKLEVLIVSDGSSDRTVDILKAVPDPGIEKIFLPVRKGKSNALNEAVSRSRNDILIFSDASTLFAPDAAKNLVRHFSDPRVGAVCGALQFQGSEESRQTEGVYWKYESMLRLMETRLGATLTASGAIYALRRECYPKLSADTLIEDFVIPMNARRLGYRVLYDPEAVATEFSASTVGGEFTRRVRLAAGSFKALGQLIRTRQSAFTFWAFLSHKFLRWVVPFLLIAAFLSNIFLVESSPYRLLLGSQVIFYVWAAVGFMLRRRPGRIPFARMGYFVVAMNLAYLLGFIRYVSGRGEATWQRVN
jgi:cellulose synthase/poly-beta-1,6-N-acetylglucosamine synthase-like glycosyltransferase